MNKDLNLMKELAKDYVCNQIKISSIFSFVRQPGFFQDRYFTTKGAFIFPLRGKCRIHFDQEVFIAEPGRLIHGCPKKHLEFEVISNEPFSHINLYYDTDKLLLFDTKLANIDVLADKLQELLSLQKRKDMKSILAKEQLASFIFENIFSDYLEENIQNNQALIDQVILYIHDNYDKPLTLSKLSHFAGKSEAQLSYLFHRHYGIRPIDYLISYRMKQAMRMLKYDELPVQDIAHSVGYGDPLYFSRLFKKHVGCPPSQFRSLSTYDCNNLFSSHSNAAL